MQKPWPAFSNKTGPVFLRATKKALIKTHKRVAYQDKEPLNAMPFLFSPSSQGARLLPMNDYLFFNGSLETDGENKK